MLRVARSLLVGGAVAAGSIFATDTADAQWGYYGPTYGSSFSFGFSTGPTYQSHYYPSYSYAAPPTYYGYSTYSAPVYSYGGPVYARPRGRVKYDVYSPFGRHEVKYRMRRNGTVRVDVDY